MKPLPPLVTVTAPQPSGLVLTAPIAATITITAESATRLLACAPAAATVTVTAAAPAAHVHIACNVGTTVTVTANHAESIIIYAGRGATVTVTAPTATAILLICPRSAALSLGTGTNSSAVRWFSPAQAAAVTSPDGALTEALDTGSCPLNSQLTNKLTTLTDYAAGTVTVTPDTPGAATVGILTINAPSATGTVSDIRIL